MDRRTFLATVGAAVGTAGCTAADESPEPTPEQVRQPVYDIDVRVTIPEHDYWHHGILLDGDGYIDYRFAVATGPRLDAYVIPYGQYRAFGNKDEFAAVDDLSRYHERETHASGDLDADEYVVAVDNSTRGATDPPINFQADPATVDIAVDAGIYRPEK